MAGCTVVTAGVVDIGILLPKTSFNVPAKVNTPLVPALPPGPLPSLPSVTIYLAVITVLFSSFLPKIPSPNNN